MISLYDRTSFERVASLCAKPDLKRLLTARIAGFQGDGYDLTKLTHILVIEPGDTEPDIIEEIGLSPLVNAIDGVRYGDPAFVPTWDWLSDLGGWFELILTVGNSGFAYILLIQDADGVDPALLALCREHCR